ncbi:MAG: response regulator [Alphaproteobacteria bacterium]|nr:response regulator [Alphaproteobacteria bacterium]
MLLRKAASNSVLLVDDEPLILMALKQQLEDHYTVFSQTSPVKALDVLRNEPDIAVVISDLRLPDMTGDEFLARAQSFSSATRMLMTGFADINAVVRAINDGKIFAYISKPWDPHHLAIMVHRAIEHYEITRTLVEERALLGDLMDSLPDAVSFKDLDGRFVKINQAKARLIGVTNPETAVGQRLSSYWPQDRAQRVEQIENEVASTGRPVVDDIEHLRGTEGEERWVSRTVVPVRNGRNKVISVIAMTRDVTEREAARKALSDSERQHRLLYNRAPVMMYSTDAEHRLTTVSDQWCATLGHTREHAIGRQATEFMSEATRHAWKSEILPQLIQTGQVRDVEIKLVANGGKPIDALLSLVAEKDGSGAIIRILAVVIDVREQKALERQLRQAQKMEAVGQLTGGIAHDFNNLLMVILGNVELIEDEVGDNEALNEALAVVQRAALRGSELTHRLLAFSRQQMLEPTDLDMNAAVSGLAGMLSRTLGEHIEMRTNLKPDLWVTRVDPAQFESAIINLCVNARDAMPSGGSLTLETDNVTIGVEAVKAGVQPGDYVMVCVRDTGTGMPPEVLDRVLEPFFTTKEPGKGTGLGLSMVYGFVKQSGGHLDISSTVGQGTTLKLMFPRTRAQASPLAVNATAAMPKGSETILIVEDQADVRNIAVAMLNSLGYRTLIAEAAAGALEILTSDAAVDLLFTDVVMPGMSGIELAQRGRAMRPGLKVLFCSGYREGAMRESGESAEGDAWIAKPFRRRRLAERVREVLDSK